jgi:uncharacterized membrane protein
MATERGFVHEGNMPIETRPGRFGYFAAAALAVGGVVACVVIIIWFVARFDGGARFVVPGSHVITVEKAGKQVIWNDYRTVFQGRSYSASEQLPDGLHIRVTEAATGKDVDIEPDRGASSKTSAAERVSIASFEAVPGRYTIAVEGNFPPRVFSVGPSFLLQLFGTIALAVAAMFLGFAVALALAIWTFLRRHPSAPASGPAPVAGTAPPPALPVIAVKTTSEETARQAAIAVYALQAASFLVVITMIAGVILDYVKREDVAGTWLESHYTWQIRTFWWWLFWMAVAAVLAIVFVGIAVALVNQIWLLYRLIKGWIRLSEGRPMYSKS